VSGDYNPEEMPKPKLTKPEQVEQEELLATLKRAADGPELWHSIGSRDATKRAVALLEKPEVIEVNRLMNVHRLKPPITRDIHNVGSLADLDVSLTIAGDRPMSKLNLNYTMDIGNETTCSVRIATADMVQGALPTSSSVFIDVEVFTNEGYKTEQKSDVDKWLEFAHENEKQEFFHLLKQDTITALEEK
jgi:hypothetical protein